MSAWPPSATLAIDFPAEIIQHAIWLFCPLYPELLDVEKRLAERGLDISHETVRCWVLKFGPVIA
jgi:transposase-like protein